jgi:site-specific DNA recombinase
MSTPNSTNGLRFASSIRVSTEAQEEQGQSLQTQRDHNARDVALLGGTIVATYGGQEHATEGWERRELERLLADASKRKFDAVIIANADRWDRGSELGRRAYEVFKQVGIRFFVSCTEYDLFNPEHRLFLDLAGVIGKYQAANSKRKSVLNRIARAREGRPTAGKLPYGRTYAPDKGWGLDPAKVATAERAARLYLGGTSLIEVAKTIGMSLSNLHATLNKHAGDTWVQVFDAPDLNIHEEVILTVPRLLPEETVRAIRDRAENRRTYNSKRVPRPYLLARVIRCGHCGHGLYPHVGRGTPYYKHFNPSRMKDRTCPDPRATIRADAVEESVLRHLFDLFGNPSAVQRAVEAAVPDLTKVEGARRRLADLEVAQKRIVAREDRVMDEIADGTITREMVKRKMDKIRAEGEGVRRELAEVQAVLASVPTREEVEQMSHKVVRAFRPHVDYKRLYETRTINADYDGMSFADKRHLIELVLCGRTPDGRRMGVFVTRDAGQRRRWRQSWTLRLLGKLVDEFIRAPTPAWLADEYENHAPLQDALVDTTGETFARGCPGAPLIPV